MTHKPDRPLLGILLMLGFCLVAPLADGFAKQLGGQIPVMQLVALRFGFQAAILVPVVLLGRRPWRMPARILGLVLWRTLLQVAGIALMFMALTRLPLADAVAIAYVMPFLMLLLGWFYLGEEVGVRRLAACAVGFAGTLMVMQPNLAEAGWAAALPLGVAVIFALYMLVTRQIARVTDPLTVQAVAGIAGCAALVPLLWLFAGQGHALLSPAPVPRGVWGEVVALGLLGTCGHLLMTFSLRFAPTATLAPLQYVEIPAAVLVGWLMFADFPDGLAAVGIAVTLAAGLYIVLREQAVARHAQADVAKGMDDTARSV